MLQNGIDMRFATRLFFFSLILSVFSLLLSIKISSFAFAASPTPTTAQANPYVSPNTNPDVPNNLHNWTQSAMIEVMSALSCQLSGIDPTNPNQQCLGVDQKTGKIGFVENGGGAIGVMDKLITMTFTMPIHTGDYVSYLSQNFGVSKQAYAQGVGFEKLSPFLPIWVAFRNLVYLLFILVFVVIGMFIMLRVQFDPRTVFTVQNQIPKLIIGIILVTFSFAIAGLMIDAMYIVIYFAYGVALTIPGADLGNINLSTIQGQSAISVFGGGGFLGVGGANGISNTAALAFSGGIKSALGMGTEPVTGIVSNLVYSLFGQPGKITPIGTSLADIVINLVSGVGGYIAANGIMKISPDFNTPIIGDIVNLFKSGGKIPLTGAIYLSIQGILRDFIPWGIGYLIVLIAIFSALFKLWFELIKAYTFILFDIVLAPFWIISSLTPGNPAGFSLWIRAVLSNLSVFPTTIVMFLLGQLFINAFKDKTPDTFFVPPLIGNAATPNLIGSIIGLTVILTTPAVVGMVKNAFKAPNFPLTTAGKMFGVGTGAPGGLFTGAGQIGLSLSGLSSIPGVNKLPIIRNISEGRGGKPTH